MSLRALDWALSIRVRDVGGPAAKVILFALADESDDTGVCYSSDQSIADKCEVTEKVVGATLRRLAGAGYLYIDRMPDLDPGGTRYRLAIDTRNATPACD